MTSEIAPITELVGGRVPAPPRKAGAREAAVPDTVESTRLTETDKKDIEELETIEIVLDFSLLLRFVCLLLRSFELREKQRTNEPTIQVH